MALAIYSADGSVRPPEHWAVVPDLVWEVATYLDRPRDVLSMGLVNWRFRDAIDDSVWRVLCHRPVTDRIPRPFPSFQHYYRAAIMQTPTESVTNAYGPLPQGVSRRGNIIQRDHHGVFGNDTTLPIIRTTKQGRCQILLLDRAEHIYLGVASSVAPSATTALTGNGYQLYVMPFVIPGAVLQLQTLTTTVNGVSTLCLKATRPAVEDGIEDVVMCEPLPWSYRPDWCFAVGLGAHGASCAVL
jgi:hypothetical protein